jgi:hypothetical protein
MNTPNNASDRATMLYVRFRKAIQQTIRYLEVGVVYGVGQHTQTVGSGLQEVLERGEGKFSRPEGEVRDEESWIPHQEHQGC